MGRVVPVDALTSGDLGARVTGILPSASTRGVVSGATGLLGSRLVQHLRAGGYRVDRLVRSARAAQPGDVAWDPVGQTIDTTALEGVTAVVHLAGENVGSGRWTRAKKTRIRDSRVLGTRLLVDALAQLAAPPEVVLSASAVGYYGDRGEEWLDESSPPGLGFLAEVCQAWEAEAERAADHGVRVARYRLGLVLAPNGGALGRMLPLFRWGLGGKLGDGRQYQSWVAVDDLMRAFEHGLAQPEVRGAVNAVSPSPVTNAEFARTLGRVLGRPAVLPAPRFALRLGLGELAGELVSSQRVRPSLLQRTGFEFGAPTLEPALRALLG
jgi:uncharacterized protein (TIGR01777 family)